jgi:MFS family permease
MDVMTDSLGQFPSTRESAPNPIYQISFARHSFNSFSSLTSGSCLLLAGSIADVVGNRKVNLVGCFIVACFILACGLARTGIELIFFRAMQGIAVSLCFPTSVAILANALPSGKSRNIGFSCLGFVQPVGFSMVCTHLNIQAKAAGLSTTYKYNINFRML